MKYFVVLLLLIVFVSYSSKIIIKSFQLPIKNVNNYNEIDNITTFLYIPSKISTKLYCNFNINCGNENKHKNFYIYTNKIKIINISLQGLTRPITCLESVSCGSMTKNYKITVYPFFETPPDQGEPYIVTNEYWILKQSNPIFIINNQSSEYVCKLKINNLEYNLDLKPGEIKEIKYFLFKYSFGFDKLNKIVLNCVFVYDKYRRIKRVIYTTSIEERNNKPYGLINIGDYVNINAVKKLDSFYIYIKNNYKDNVYCFVNITNANPELSYLYKIPKNTKYSLRFPLSSLNLKIGSITTVKFNVVCYSEYSIPIKKKFTFTFYLQKEIKSKIDMKVKTDRLLSISISKIKTIINLYNELKGCYNGNIYDKINKIIDDINKIKTNTNNIQNATVKLTHIISEEDALLNKLNAKKSVLITKYIPKENLFKSELFSTLLLYAQVKSCTPSDITNELDKIIIFKLYKDNLQNICYSINKIPEYLEKLKEIKIMLYNIINKCEINIDTKSISNLCSEIMSFKNQFSELYVEYPFIYIPIRTKLDNYYFECISILRKIKNKIFTKYLLTKYEIIRIGFENIYVILLNKLDSLIKIYNTLKKLNKIKKIDIDNIYTNIHKIIKSNKDLITNYKQIVSDINLLYFVLNPKIVKTTEVYIFATDNLNMPVQFASVFLNNKFIGYTNKKGLIILNLKRGVYSITIKSLDYKTVTKKIIISNPFNKKTIIEKFILTYKQAKYPAYPETVAQFITSKYIFAFVCSTLNHPICDTNGNGEQPIITLHPYSKEIQSLVSKIPPKQIYECKHKGKCVPLLLTIENLVNNEITYNNNCITNGKGCMAWWGSDLGILKYHSGVCADFATLTVSLLRAIGIPAMYVELDAEINNIFWRFIFHGSCFPHAFTMVYIDNHWVFYDTLWKYIGKPNYYPISCFNDVYGIAAYKNENSVDLSKLFEKYYPKCKS